METTRSAKLLRIHFAEDDKYEGKPLYEAVVEKCRKMSIVGATVFRGLEGYGQSAEIHRAHWITHDQPIVVTIIDTDAKIRQLLPVLEVMMDTVVMAICEVELLRVRRTLRHEASGKHPLVQLHSARHWLASLFSDLSHEAVTSLLPTLLTSLGAAAGALGTIEAVSDGFSSIARLYGGW